ncbi:MAG: single-stranded DNA-binding protein, partial [Phycisphaerae bacterium]
LKLNGTIMPPAVQHPQRPIQGLSCPRSEVSGARLWGFAKERFGTPTNFFRTFFVGNYCPLAFLGLTGANITPDKIERNTRDALLAICDEALREWMQILEPRMVVGVGAFAEKRAAIALAESGVRIGRILHPSPASPAANRDWGGKVATQLAELGIAIPS